VFFDARLKRSLPTSRSVVVAAFSINTMGTEASPLWFRLQLWTTGLALHQKASTTKKKTLASVHHFKIKIKLTEPKKKTCIRLLIKFKL
jgi:hypothetical protein